MNCVTDTPDEDRDKGKTSCVSEYNPEPQVGSFSVIVNDIAKSDERFIAKALLVSIGADNEFVPSNMSIPKSEAEAVCVCEDD
jgi:hypothetical protein